MITNYYDQYFQRYALEFFGNLLPWLWFKAQAMVESELNPEAVSPVGALGVMQLMPGTAVEMAAKHPAGDGTILTPHINIRLGILGSPLELHDLIIHKNRERNKARLVAGYCWNWGPVKENGQNGVFSFLKEFGNKHTKMNVKRAQSFPYMTE